MLHAVVFAPCICFTARSAIVRNRIWQNVGRISRLAGSSLLRGRSLWFLTNREREQPACDRQSNDDPRHRGTRECWDGRHCVQRDGPGPSEGERERGGDVHGVELVTAVGLPIAL